MTGKPRALILLSICQVAALSLWFSASAVIPSLRLEFSLNDHQAALLTSTVQMGFVAGTLVSALLGLADRIDPRRFFMFSTVIATGANAVLLIADPASPTVLVCRFLTGACMAGVYPVGMRMVASWADKDLGLLVGLLVGALTLGSAAPHLFNAFGGVDWRLAIAAASLASLAAAFLINFVPLGPNWAAAPPFKPRAVLAALSDKALRLVNLGYLGHMWELYAMWAWLGIFLNTSFQLSGAFTSAPDASFWARMATFGAMGIGGGAGCLIGGYIADRMGRTFLTMAAMSMSATCALIVGFFFGGAPILTFLVCFIWGATIVADSAQFSASIAELAPKDRIGTMLTIQTSMGFLLTLATIHLMPLAIDAFGWRYAFMALAIGPILGVVAMGRLRAHPDAQRLANGRR
ncbi:MAG: MFS transporter [Alphaproteobacteria bacterium]|nr:MFS transporter [Alphaproteobacteria bacterium]